MINSWSLSLYHSIQYATFIPSCFDISLLLTKSPVSARFAHHPHPHIAMKRTMPDRECMCLPQPKSASRATACVQIRCCFSGRKASHIYNRWATAPPYTTLPWPMCVHECECVREHTTIDMLHFPFPFIWLTLFTYLIYLNLQRLTVWFVRTVHCAKTVLRCFFGRCLFVSFYSILHCTQAHAYGPTDKAVLQIRANRASVTVSAAASLTWFVWNTRFWLSAQVANVHGGAPSCIFFFFCENCWHRKIGWYRSRALFSLLFIWSVIFLLLASGRRSTHEIGIGCHVQIRMSRYCV